MNKKRTDGPNRHHRLVCWYLVYRINLETNLQAEDETAACVHCHLDPLEWNLVKAQWPRIWEKVLAKRQRRLDWHLKHGTVPDGWTPPDPKDRRSANRPIAAYLALRGMTIDEFDARNAWLSGRSKTGGHKRPWGPN